LKFFLGGLGNWSKDYALIENAVIEADKLGFDGALIPDHYMWGQTEWLRRPDSNTTLESWIALSYLAGKTTQVKLGTLVTPIPFRPPSIMAKMVSTLDVLSGGRTVFGVGAGWSQVEFDGYSEWNEPKVRVDKTAEGLELMIQLWTQAEVTFNGQFYHAKKAILEPKPIQQPYPPLLFGGRKHRMLRLAGKYGDIIFIPQFGESEPYAERKKIVVTAAKKANREHKLAFMEGPMMTMGTYNSEQFVKHVEAAKESGATYFLTSIPRSEQLIESIQSFARDVIPSFK
jgi:alkanesulfonate monooxygenase SsuD/methylene tetrahydromethanopterin reductase-like flavin-dependent oxidoreductase (luciferase family)